MKKRTLIMLFTLGTILASCGGLPALTLTPSTGTFVLGDPTASHIVITGAPTDAIIHYNIKTDGTAVPTCYCNACSFIYSGDTDIPLDLGVTSVNAVACDTNGVPVTSNGISEVTITEAP